AGSLGQRYRRPGTASPNGFFSRPPSPPTPISKQASAPSSNCEGVNPPLPLQTLTPFLFRCNPPAAMALNQAAVPRDPRPSNPAAKKVKLLCSFGGRILPRPSDGALRYVGGHTRILALSRDAPFHELMRKASDTYGGAAVLKYQLPGEDLDALVSVSSREDLENMMEEYDKLAGYSPEGSAKLRVFLFSPAEVDGSDLGLGADDVHDGGQRYMDAVNGIADLGMSAMKRKESVASVSSMQSSEGGAGELDGAADGVPPPIVPPIFAAAAPQDTSGSVRSGVGSDPSFPESAMAALPVNVNSTTGVPPRMLDSSQLFRPLAPSGAGVTYAPPTYIESLPDGFNYIHNPGQNHHVDPQQSGLAGVPVGFVALPQHSFLPPVHVPAANPTFQVNRGQRVQGRVETCLEDVSSGGRITQVAGDPAYKSLQPLSQLPPLPPFSLQSQNIERFGLHQTPAQVLPPGQSLRLEDCGLCQRALPHAHSDPLIQDYSGSGITTSVPDKSPTFYSLHPNSASTYALLSAVNGVMPDNTAVENHLHDVVPPHSGAYGYSQIPEVQKDAKVAQQKAEIIDQTNAFALFPPGLGFTHPQATHGLYFSSHPYAWSEDMLHQQQKPPLVPPQYLHRHDHVISDSGGVNISSARNETVQSSGQSVQDAEVESSCDYTRRIKMEGPLVNQFQASGLEHQIPATKPHPDVSAPLIESLYINPSETLVASEPGKTVSGAEFGASTELNIENIQIVEENMENSRAKVGKNDAFPGASAVIPSIAVGMQSFIPADLVPSCMEAPHLHYFHPGDPNQVLPFIGNAGPYSHHFELGIEPPIPPERLLQGPSATAKANDVSASLKVNLPFQSPNESMYNMHTGGVQGPVPSESLFLNPEPPQIMQNNYLPALKPTRVASKDKLLSSVLCMDNHLRGKDESRIDAQWDEVSHEQPLDSLSNDTNPGSELLKQKLQAVVDGLAEPVLQQSIPLPASYAHENDSASESNRYRDIEEGNVNSHSTLHPLDYKAEVYPIPSVSPSSLQSSELMGFMAVQEVKVGQMDEPNLGGQVVEDIMHLQIIKNSDLEELQELGSGTFGTVYHGKWRGSDVAIKRINDRCFVGKQTEQEHWASRDDFWNEACKLADLHHPNVVAFYGVVRDGPGGSMATVTEYMVNGSLRQALHKNDKTFDRRKRLLIAMDVAFGMEYLHGKNIVHFDLKSDNLLVNLRDPQRPICKVGDLGLSKVKRQTLISGGVRGTLPWMAPELLNGSSSLVSEKVDVFSFGIVMWELLTGEEPYANLHYGAIIGGIVNNTLRPPVPESCDPEWRSLMERCWVSEPSERPSFSEIANKLRAMATSVPLKAQVQTQTAVPAQAQK
ncbi:hypothetical protein Taro_003497, partial [Colocasia esculenta]|nr:hypothetical protein [Colocasia esculenta]